MLEQSDSRGQKAEWRLPGAVGGGGWRVFNGHRAPVWEDDVLEVDGGDDCRTA